MVPGLAGGGNLVPAGENGIDGGNENGIKQPEKLEFNEKIQIINTFKRFIRASLSKSIYGNALEIFLRTIEKNKEISTIY